MIIKNIILNKFKTLFFIILLIILVCILGLIAIISRNLLNKKNIIKIEEKRLRYWVFLFSVSLFCVGIFEFIYFWIIRNDIISAWNTHTYMWFSPDSFKSYFVWFTQVYSVLFIPLLVFIGLKYRSRVNGNKTKILGSLFLVILFIFLNFYYQISVISEWIFLFMIIFIITSLKYGVLFSFSFSYLCFYMANMLWEMAELNFLNRFGTLLSYILVYSVFILVLYKLKIKLNFINYLSIIPILFSWIYYYPIWQIKNMTEFSIKILPIQPYIRLFTFPFFITISLTVYFKNRQLQNGKP